jgi:hypothetical protein
MTLKVRLKFGTFLNGKNEGKNLCCMMKSAQETNNRRYMMGNGNPEISVDPFEVRKLYKYLRVVDVVDRMDGIGYFDIGLMDTEVRPLWSGMKFWGLK